MFESSAPSFLKKSLANIEYQQHWEVRDQRIPGACWPAGLIESMTLKSVRDSDSETKLQNDRRHLTTTYSLHTQMPVQTHTHTQLYPLKRVFIGKHCSGYTPRTVKGVSKRCLHIQVHGSATHRNQNPLVQAQDILYPCPRILLNTHL